MNRWTQYLGGGAKEDINNANQPLMPQSHPIDTSQAQPSAPPYSSPAVDVEYPDPVKPGKQQSQQQQQHSSSTQYNQTMPSYQAEQSTYPQPPYQQPYPGLQHATQPPVYVAPPLVVNREMVVLEPLRGTHVVIACPHCGHSGPAAVSKESGFVTFFSSFLLCFLGCCILSVFPFCSDCTKDWVYRCARCGTLFGRERP